jgi:hypothetical protein
MLVIDHPPIPLSAQGLLKILKRTNSAIRDDGRWYVLPHVLEQVIQARRILGVERKSAEVVQSN